MTTTSSSSASKESSSSTSKTARSTLAPQQGFVVPKAWSTARERRSVRHSHGRERGHRSNRGLRPRRGQRRTRSPEAPLPIAAYSSSVSTKYPTAPANRLHGARPTAARTAGGSAHAPAAAALRDRPLPRRVRARTRGCDPSRAPSTDDARSRWTCVPVISRSIASWISASDSESRLDVASSRIRIGASARNARASATR